MEPSFAIGGNIGFRPIPWLIFGGLYRWGMFNPDFDVAGSDRYQWAGQHTVGLFVRPVLPIWRFDLGVNIAPSYARQVFVRNNNSAEDYSQGFAVLVGPTIDFFLTDRFFIGAEIDFVFNTQNELCRNVGGEVRCFEDDELAIAPTHQVLFGLHVGGLLF